MSTNRKTLIILVVLWLLAFLAKPRIVNGILPPLLLILAWLAVAGPSFKTSPRHPDIKRVLHSKTMRRMLLRPDWVPQKLHGAWFIALVVALLSPGLLVVLWQSSLVEQLALGDVIWWLIMVPAILCASTHVIEALIKQMVALPFVGVLIILLLLFAPAGSKVGGDDPTTLAYWLPSLIAFLGAVWSLWLIDLLRAVDPRSERCRRLANWD